MGPPYRDEEIDLNQSESSPLVRFAQLAGVPGGAVTVEMNTFSHSTEYCVLQK
jgi:hypothetical protein